ncbi:hypothetical protein Tco_1509223 [Tanacetum coccineum]
MVLELADRTISKPTGCAENVFVKVGKFYFPADFVVLGFFALLEYPFDYSGPHFLRTAHALIDVYEGEITLRNDDQSLTLKCGDAPSISYNNLESLKKVDLIDVTCEEYSQEVLGFSDSVAYNNPSPYFDPIVSTYIQHFILLMKSDFYSLKMRSFLSQSNDEPGFTCFLMLHTLIPRVNFSYLEALLHIDPLPYQIKEIISPGIHKIIKLSNQRSLQSNMLLLMNQRMKFPKSSLKSYLRISRSLRFEIPFQQKDAKKMLRWVLLLQEFVFRILPTILRRPPSFR